MQFEIFHMNGVTMTAHGVEKLADQIVAWKPKLDRAKVKGMILALWNCDG